MKLIPYIKYQQTFKNESIDDIENSINKIIGKELKQSELQTLPNIRKKYDGYILKEKQIFKIWRNWGSQKSNFIYCHGSYESSGNETTIFITIRPETISMLLPIVSAGLAFWKANNLFGPFIIFLIVYSLMCVIPFNFVGIEMMKDIMVSINSSNKQ